MIISIDDLGTPHAEAIGRLSYSSNYPFMYIADIHDASPDVLSILREIDADMALDPEHPHAIENWNQLI